MASRCSRESRYSRVGGGRDFGGGVDRCPRFSRGSRVGVGRDFGGGGSRCPRFSRDSRVGVEGGALGAICVLGAFQGICEASLKRV